MFFKFITLIFSAVAFSATTQIPQRLNLSDVLLAVRDHDPALASARADTRMADQMAKAAYAWMPPQLGIELMGLDAVSPNLSNPMQRKFSLTQELPFPGRTWAQGRAASHLAEARHAEADMAEQQELKAAREAYYNLVAAEHLLKGLDRVSQATREMARVSDRRGSFGQLNRMGQFMDTMLAMEDSNVDSMRPMVLQQRRSAEAILQRLMGVDPFQPLSLTQVTVEAMLEESLPELKEALKDAEARSPELKAAQVRWIAAEAAHSLALSGWLPDLMVQGSVSEDSVGNRQAGAMLGINLPWLWFWKQSGEVGAARAAADKARQDLEATRLALRQQVRDAVGEAQAATEALRVTWTRTYPKASKGLDLARTGFRTTALGASEILMAVQDYRMTEEKLAQLIAQQGAAQAMLKMLTAAPVGVGVLAEGAKP